VRGIVAFALIAPAAMFAFIFLQFMEYIPPTFGTSYWLEAIALAAALLLGILLILISLRIMLLNKSAAAGILGLYLITLFVASIVVGFAVDFKALNQVAPTFPTKEPYTLSKSDYLYFSAITWTTVGYGDFIPVAKPTRMLAAEEAIFGYVFMAVYLGYMLSLLNFIAEKWRVDRGPSQNPPLNHSSSGSS
jgi:hypothetical protein